MPGVYKLVRRGVKRLSDNRILSPEGTPAEWRTYQEWRRQGYWQKVLVDGALLDVWVGNEPDPPDPEQPTPPPAINPPNAREALMRRERKASRNIPRRVRRELP